MANGQGTTAADLARDLESAGRRAAEHPVAQRLACWGLVAKGVVYGTIALLSARLALGLGGGKTTDARGALATIAREPWGGPVVALLGVGLLGLGLWFLIDALADPLKTRHGAWGAVVRVAQAVGGLGYLSMGGWAVMLVLGASRSRGSDAVAKSWTARLLGEPWGPALLVAVAIVALVVGLRQVKLGASRGFLKTVDLSRLAARARRWAPRLGAVGFVTQGVVVSLIGVFLVQAVWEHDAREATGFDGALAALAGWSGGPLLLGCAAAGLAAYATYAFVESRCRRFGPR